MNKLTKNFLLVTSLGMALLTFNSCQTTDGGNPGYYDSPGNYSSGYYDPWYHGGYCDHPDFIVTPPGNRPDRPLAPTHPIARPPMGGGGFGGGGFGGGGRGGGGRR